MSLRKSSRRRNGSKSEVAPKPNARRRCTPAPSRVGLALMRRFTGRIDILAYQEFTLLNRIGCQAPANPKTYEHAVVYYYSLLSLRAAAIVYGAYRITP